MPAEAGQKPTIRHPGPTSDHDKGNFSIAPIVRFLNAQKKYYKIKDNIK